MVELHSVIELVAENFEESLGELRRHHNMHTLQGKWKGRCECHVANAGDWLVRPRCPCCTSYAYPTSPFDFGWGGLFIALHNKRDAQSRSHHQLKRPSSVIAT